jgi:hypothetical protein
MHENRKLYSGQIGLDNVDAIADLVRKTEAKRLLDYGSGKGYQYLRDRVHERWGGILPHCYDVGVRQLCARPEGPFDGVICTDVLEHIRETDVNFIISDILSMLRKDRLSFAYFNISCNVSGREIFQGVSAHLTVKPPDWWDRLLKRRERKNLILHADYEYEN